MAAGTPLDHLKGISLSRTQELDAVWEQARWWQQLADKAKERGDKATADMLQGNVDAALRYLTRRLTKAANSSN